MNTKKYQIKYDKFIENRKNRILNGYTETHHIIPKCLKGSDEKFNLIELTPREHFSRIYCSQKFTPTTKKFLERLVA
jgi:hypothetical protein